MDFYTGIILGAILAVVIIAINLLAGNTKVKPKKANAAHLRRSRASSGISTSGYTTIARNRGNRRYSACYQNLVK